MGYIFGTNTVSDISKFTKITPAVKHPVILKFTLFESKANIYPQRASRHHEIYTGIETVFLTCKYNFQMWWKYYLPSPITFPKFLSL